MSIPVPSITPATCQSRPETTRNDRHRFAAASTPMEEGGRKDLPVPLSVAAWAEAAPGAPAVVAGREVLTYGELDRQANQLAHYLITLGVGPESLVALCLERSLEAVVGALGILKAGGAYLPLDPAYPVERLAFMLNDAQPVVLVTRQKVAERLPCGAWRVVAIDHAGPQIHRHATHSPTSIVTAESLAYVIYTSGSTGQPKGVEITHGSLRNLVGWHQKAFEVTADDKASLLADVGFDAAIWETWPYLSAGASLHLPDKITRVSPELLRDWLVAEGVTISFLPTAVAEHVIGLEWPANTALRILLTGADTLHRYPPSGLPFSLVNNYGPTECTVVASSGAVLPGVSTDDLPTIGKPIANTEIYILDENLRQVPTGTAGELHIAGAGVARGYLNRPELTLEKFIQNPFAAGLSSRLYKTGDMASYRADGEIAYLGRIDDQLKILGYRIEPHEIVAELDRHPSIQASVVMARDNGFSDMHLVAYVVLRPDSHPTAADLRSFLGKKLPDYMVPAVFVPLETLPLTQNGKIDRAQLPTTNSKNTLRDEEFMAPRTPLEQRLAVMLSSLLGLESVSINDNFFFLGGHSLLGTQLIGQVRSAFGVDLALRSLFDAPTIAGLSSEIERLLIARVEAMSEDEVQRLLL